MTVVLCPSTRQGLYRSRESMCDVVESINTFFSFVKLTPYFTTVILIAEILHKCQNQGLSKLKSVAS